MNKLYSIDNKFIKETDSIPNNFTGIVDYDNGSKFWFVNGEYHRLDGPACEYADGRIMWYKEGKLHRIDGPAWINGSTKVWVVNATYYRIGGPALVRADGTKEWWIEHKSVTREEHDLLFDIMKLKGLL